MKKESLDYEFVGSQPSYYSAKVRACLQYKRVPYIELGSDSETIASRVIPLTGDHTFPVVFCPDGQILKDGCDIVLAMEERHPERPLFPTNSVINLYSNIIELMCDEFFTAAAIYYRWMPEDTRAWALEMFPIIAKKGVKDPAILQNATALSDGIASSVQERMGKVGLGRKDVQNECVRLTEKLCDLLDKHFSSVPFALGDHPTVADLALNNAIWGHLFLDPCDASIYIRRNCIYLSQWVTQMQSAAGIGHVGDLYISETFVDILNFFGESFAKMAVAVQAAADSTIPEMEISHPARRGVGRISAPFGSVEVSRPAATYTAWRLQRCCEVYLDLTPAEKKEADKVLRKTGLSEIFKHRPSWRLGKRKFKIYRLQ